ncbi:hypothetical protein AB6A40_010406 [Gnathostoma spinigerum]|uniref:imidazolonepropionase n=1 Tax=Gnathostoma spinigerum TaxID=75299 RepID=A0ABD6EX61_9BILA
MEYRLLLHGARQIVQITDSPDVAFIVGEKEMNNIKVLESDKNNLALLVDSDGRIAKIGTDEELQAEADRMGCETRMNADGGVLMPGFVDAHSHPVFAGDRVHEFAMKLAGVTYSEIQEKGGGILFTMNKTREASEDELLSNFERSAIEMMKSGTTTLEAKSGYGLDTSNEMKLLNVIAMADEILPFEISGTFCGGHAIPKDSSEDRQTEMIVNDMLPAIVAEKNAGGLSCIENIDVFCEKGNFGVDSTRRILEAGMDAGLSVNFHAEELHRTGGAEMGAEIKVKIKIISKKKIT